MTLLAAAVRKEIGLDNVILMIPFCRTLAEADRVLAVLADNGLKRGENGLEVYVMCELPANVVLARQFAERFDGFSIGSNDLTQLVLGVERDSARLADLFDEQNEAVTELIAAVIRTAHEAGQRGRHAVCLDNGRQRLDGLYLTLPRRQVRFKSVHALGGSAGA